MDTGLCDSDHLSAFLDFILLLARVFKWFNIGPVRLRGAAFLAHPDWSTVLRSTFVPQVEWSSAYLATFRGILGTTILSLFFFWQARRR